MSSTLSRRDRFEFGLPRRPKYMVCARGSFTLFSVTRFTTRVLLLNEQVSNRCKHRTLPQRSSRDASTTGACKRETCRSHCFQLIWSQCSSAAEDATTTGSAHLRSLHRMVLPAFSSFMTCGRSACLSQRSRHFLTDPLQNDLCFFQPPFPANPSATLARHFLRIAGEVNGVKSSGRIPWLGLLYALKLAFSDAERCKQLPGDWQQSV